MVKKITFENGLRLVLAPQKDSLSTTVLVLVEAGSKYENLANNGISHFLEHMCFKGTEKRPKSIDITGELDSIGASYNAFTGLERTGYYVKARPTHLEKVLDIMSDMYLNQAFDPQEIEKEKRVILEEVNYDEDTPVRKVQDTFVGLLYGDQPAGRPILGKKENINNFIREDFIKYHNEHYLAKSTAVVIAGSFSEDGAIEKVQKYFGRILSNKKVGKVKTVEDQKFPQAVVSCKETDQSHIVLGVRTFDIFDERRFIMDVLGDILGGGMSSRLVQKIREELGAAYYVDAGSDLYSDHGYFAVSAGVDTKRIELVIGTILKELKKMAEEPVFKEELERSKEHLIGGLTLGLETSSQLAGFYGGQEITLGKWLTPKEIIKKIQEVDSKQILELAKEIFRDEQLNLAVIGPFKDKEGFEKILKF